MNLLNIITGSFTAVYSITNLYNMYNIMKVNDAHEIDKNIQDAVEYAYIKNLDNINNDKIY